MVMRAVMALPVLLLAGCATASLDVARHTRDRLMIDRLYVVFERGPLEMKEVQLFASAMQAACAGHVRAYKSSVLSGMELDPDQIKRDIAAFGADGVLMLRPIGGEIGAYGGYPKIIYGVALQDTKSGTVVWSARSVNEGGTVMTEKRNKLAADGIVAELVKEEVFRGGPAN